VTVVPVQPEETIMTGQNLRAEFERLSACADKVNREGYWYNSGNQNSNGFVNQCLNEAGLVKATGIDDQGGFHFVPALNEGLHNPIHPDASRPGFGPEIMTPEKQSFETLDGRHIETTFSSLRTPETTVVRNPDQSKEVLAYDPLDEQPWTTLTSTFAPNGDQTGVFRAFDDPGRWLSQHILQMNHLAGYDEPAAENLIASIERAAIHGAASTESLPSPLSYEPRFGPAYDFSEGDFNVDFNPTSGAVDVGLSGDLNGFDGSWIDDGELGGFDWDGGDDDGFDLFPTDFGIGSWEGGDWGPLVLDLNGDGVDIVGREDSPVYFNVDGDGMKERTAWAGRNDGFLVLDLDLAANGAGPDGAIAQMRELSFAAWTADPDDTDAARCGFPATSGSLIPHRSIFNAMSA
jgi:hypothetical protein